MGMDLGSVTDIEQSEGLGKSSRRTSLSETAQKYLKATGWQFHIMSSCVIPRYMNVRTSLTAFASFETVARPLDFLIQLGTSLTGVLARSDGRWKLQINLYLASQANTFHVNSPARFYIDLIAKILFSNLILDYDMKLFNPTMKKDWTFGLSEFPNPRSKLLIRKRQA